MNIEDLNQDFRRAVINGDIEAATQCIVAGADINTTTDNGNNVLYLAASRNRKEMFEWLLEIEKAGQKINVDNRNVNGGTTLYECIKEGDKEFFVEKLIEKQANPNIGINDGITPLIRAVADSRKDEITLLLKSPQIDVNHAIKGTETTAFLMAVTAASGSEAVEICQLLLDNGANIEAKDAHGKSGLINALFRTKQFMKKREKKEHKELCKFLITKSQDLNYVAPSGMSAFWLAANSGDRELMNMMLDLNVNTNVWHSVGMSGVSSALHSVMQVFGKDPSQPNPQDPSKPLPVDPEEDIKLIQRIIAQGGNINAPDEEGNTPAVFGFLNPEARNAVVDLGGDVNAVLFQKDAKGKIFRTPVISMIAQSGDKQIELVEKMIQAGAKVSFTDDKDLEAAEPIFQAIASSAVSIMEAILNTGKVNVNHLYASEKNEISILSYLMASQNNPNFTKMIKEKEKIERILEANEVNKQNGVTSKIIDEEGIESLREQLEQFKHLEEDLDNNREKMFKLLIANGANVNLENKDGFTALFYATSEKNIDLLLNNGADFFHKNGKGDTYLISAIKNNSPVFKTILEKFKKANDVSFTEMYYQLAFTEAKTDYQRQMIESAIVSLLTEDERKDAFFRVDKKFVGPLPERKKVVMENINFQDEDGNSPLLVACSQDVAFLVALYTRIGADVNLANNNGETPLMHAIAANNDKVVEFLIENKADINAKTNDGKTVLEFAEEVANVEILEQVKIALGYNIEQGQLTGYKKYRM